MSPFFYVWRPFMTHLNMPSGWQMSHNSCLIFAKSKIRIDRRDSYA